ncbi:copper-translocating P-type ATPase [soil metagenome]
MSKNKDGSKNPEKINNTNTVDNQYYCPMHCEGDKTYNAPGDCPVCGMDLKKADKVISETAKYTCPMHPEIIRSEPGDCPICGMDLIPIAISETDEEDQTYLKLLNRFKVSTLFTIPIFLIAMSDMVPGFHITELLPMKTWNWIQFVLSLPVIYSCSIFFERAYVSIKTWNLNMFTLIGIGTGISFLFSITSLLFPEIFPAQFKTESGTVYVYFEATTVILSLVLLGQLLEARAHSKTSGAIRELLKLVPSQATLIENGEEKVISINDIKKGDLLRVKPGEKIPVDGILEEGNGTIDESMITGEPVPVDKITGDVVRSGTINTTRSFIMKTEKVGSETLLSQIIKMVNEASRSRAPIQKLADKISKYFVPIVILISVLTFAAWMIFGPEPRLVYAFVNSIAVLIIACPCALGLATPMSIMVGVGRSARSGVLVKNAEALENMNKVDTLIIDKTGTLTEGKPSVEKIVTTDGNVESELLQKIASVNALSEHPLARSIVNYAKEKNIKIKKADDFDSITGKGVIGSIDGIRISIGNALLMKDENVSISKGLENEVISEQQKGKTVSFISVGGKEAGYISISDKIKSTSKKAIQELLDDNINIIMLTGDNENTAKSVADELNLSGYRSGYLPEDKLNEIKKLQAEGKIVAMAGDGINDSPALAQSDVGIAMGTGTDVAIESASITLVQGDLHGIVKARKLSRIVMKNIRQNLFFAFIYNTLGVPVAAGVLFPIFGILLSPMIAAAAMSISSVSVIANSLRLRNADLDE